MSEKILVPALGESITEATVSKWLKKVGDPVQVDEAIVELETDKVNLEVPSPLSGILSEINSKDGDTVEVGAVLGSVSEGKSNVEKKAPSKDTSSTRLYALACASFKLSPRAVAQKTLPPDVRTSLLESLVPA